MRSGIRAVVVLAIVGGLAAACGAAATPTPTPAPASVPTATPTPTPPPTATPAPTPPPVPSMSGVGPAYVTGTETLSVTTPGKQVDARDVTQLRGQVVASVDTMNDPRVTGTGTINANADMYLPVGPEWGTYKLENAGGAWEGKWTGIGWGGGDVTNVTGWLVGGGEYEGYTYYLHVWGSSKIQVEGIVFKGSPPTPAPTPAPAPTPMPVPPSVRAGPPAHIIGTTKFSLVTQFTEVQVGDVTQMRGGVITGSDTMGRRTATGSVVDSRVTGTVTLHLNVDMYGTMIGPEWGTYRLENAGGAWEGTCAGGAWAAGEASAVACWLVGSRSYEGSTYYLSSSTTGTSGVLEGIIFPGSPPTP